MMESSSTLPETALQMAQIGWNCYLRFFQQWAETTGMTGAQGAINPGAFPGQELFKVWIDIYEKEFRQFFTMPQLGLTRFHQERMGEVLDKYNLFQARMGEFISFLMRPMDKSFQAMQVRLKESADRGDPSEDSKHTYQMWIKTLEDYYMSLLKSPDYLQVMKNALEAMSEFTMARQRFLQGFLQLFSIPTYADIDDISKEVYDLKKQVQTLSKRKAARAFTQREGGYS
jgi:polyhydroxyalkanoate synthase subunit PhaE